MAPFVTSLDIKENMLNSSPEILEYGLFINLGWVPQEEKNNMIF